MSEKDERISYPSIGDTFEDMGRGFQSSIPHIVLGKDKPPKTPGIQEKQEIPSENNRPKDKNSVFAPKEIDIIDKIKKWALIAGVVLILGYAVYRIISGFFV